MIALLIVTRSLNKFFVVACFRNSLSHRIYKRNIDRSGFLHQCKNCNKTFKKPSQLERHNRIHTGWYLNV